MTDLREGAAEASVLSMVKKPTAGLYSAGFLSEPERIDLLLAMRAADRTPAASTKDGAYVVVPSARRVSRLTMAASWTDLIHQRLVNWMPRLRDHFGESIESCQEPQFLRYTEGDFHKLHRDRGLEAGEPESVRWRTVSVVIFVNPGEYDGGLLTFHESGVPASRLRVRGRPGGLVAFPSLALHEVEAVRGGERFTIAGWFEGAKP